MTWWADVPPRVVSIVSNAVSIFLKGPRFLRSAQSVVTPVPDGEGELAGTIYKVTPWKAPSSSVRTSR